MTHLEQPMHIPNQTTMTDINWKAKTTFEKVKASLAKNQAFLIYTLCNFINQVAYGINMNIVGACLIDLQYVYNTDLQGISMVPSMTSLGYMLGSLVGWLYQWVNRQLLLVILITIHAISIALVPFCGVLWLLLVIMTLNGIGGGAWDSSNSIWLVEMWPNANSATLQSSKFMYGLGTIIGPLLASSFVYGEAKENDTSSIAFNVTAGERQRSLALPFAITGVMQIIAPVILLLMFFIQPYERKLKEKIPNFNRHRSPSIYNTINSRASFQSIRTNVDYRAARHPSFNLKDDDIVDPSKVPYRMVKLSLCALAIAAYCAVELNYFCFSSVFFQKLDNPMSAAEAARVLSILATTFSIGRLITAIVSIKVVPDIIVMYHYLILIVGQLVVFFGRDSRTYIYVGTVISGLGFSAIWPGILAFTERHLRLNDKVGSILSFITGILSLIAPIIISRYMKTQPNILFFLTAFFIPVSIVTFICAIVFIHTTKNNTKS